MENTNFYTFDKITSCVNRNNKKIIDQSLFFKNQNDYWYLILQRGEEFKIKPFAVKSMDHTLVMPIEENYWNGKKLPGFYKPVF